MTAPITLALVDDHVLFRNGVRALLASQPDLEVVGEAGDARTAYAVVDETSPDVVLLDVNLPGASGLSVARELIRRQPRRKILFVSMYVTEDVVAQGIASGALGYVGKDQEASELVSAIRAVGRGHSYLSPRVSRAFVDDYMRLRRGGSPDEGPLGLLSTREREVFQLLLSGLTNDGIAKQLSISRRTVETHRTKVLRKLNVHSLAELFRFAARHGLITD
jgi:DNA-binding NarL/FixJ family response regulator